MSQNYQFAVTLSRLTSFEKYHFVLNSVTDFMKKLLHSSASVCEVCSINTRTEVIKMYFTWTLHVRVPFKVLSSPTHTLFPTVFPLLETDLVRFFCDGFQLLRRICLNLQIFFFEGFLKFW